MTSLEDWKQSARRLKRETYAVYLAAKDRRVPWHVKMLAACVVGYAFSPIDLIPDFIPVLGYLDDLILVPLGIALVLRLLPPDVLAECREAAREQEDKPTNWIAASIIVVVWIALAAVSLVLFARLWQR